MGLNNASDNSQFSMVLFTEWALLLMKNTKMPKIEAFVLLTIPYRHVEILEADYA